MLFYVSISDQETGELKGQGIITSLRCQENASADYQDRIVQKDRIDGYLGFRMDLYQML
jgi:hypothetical protein